MIALLRLIGRRMTKRKLGSSVWFRRALIVIAVARWVSRFLNRPEVVHLRKGETATVSVQQTRKSSQ